MATLDELSALGWCISQKTYAEQFNKLDNGNRHVILAHLLDTDLREFGTPWISDHKKQDQLDAQGRIVQLVRSRNIAIPQIDEDHVSATGPYSGPQFLRLTLTDGRTTVSALDVDKHEQLSMNTPPGTKIRLMGTIPLCLGFLVLRKHHLQVLGGNVANLVKEWTMTKLAKNCDGRLQTGAPPFVPFGSHEADALVRSETQFLSVLKDRRNRSDAAYDSFKTASKASTAEKENELDVDFNARRKDIINVVQQTTSSDQSAAKNGVPKPAPLRFQTGGSRFADLQVEKAQAYDEALSQLVSLNYPLPLADSALKLHKGDYKAALDYLLSKQSSSMKLNGQQSGSRSTRRRGGRSNRGRLPGGPDDVDDPRFDPAAVAAAAGLHARASTGLVRLSDFIPATENKLPTTNNPGPSRSSNLSCLPVGCPILAQNMTGEYEEAQLLGYITSPGSTASGDKVVLVVYTQRKGAAEEHEELVPLSLIRTINNEKITVDIVPPAPRERSLIYSFPTSSNTTPAYNHSNIHVRGGNPRSRSGRFPGRGGSRGRFTGSRPYRAFSGRSLPP